jgi:hypothetical protein
VIWITATSSGSGSGTASYTVMNNTSANSRSGDLTVAGQTVTVTQLGVGGPPGAPSGVRVIQTDN